MSDSDVEDSTAPLIEHLTELRTRIIRSVIAFLIGMVVCFPFAENILSILAEPMADIMRARGEDAQLFFDAPQDAFFAYVKIAVLFGFALTINAQNNTTHTKNPSDFSLGLVLLATNDTPVQRFAHSKLCKSSSKIFLILALRPSISTNFAHLILQQHLFAHCIALSLQIAYPTGNIPTNVRIHQS